MLQKVLVCVCGSPLLSLSLPLACVQQPLQLSILDREGLTLQVLTEGQCRVWCPQHKSVKTGGLARSKHSKDHRLTDILAYRR